VVSLRLENNCASLPVPRARTELGALTRIGLPLALASLGQTLLSVVSSALVGRVGANELGAVGLGSSIHFTGAVLGMGIVLGLDPIFAQAQGARDARRAMRALGQTPWLALLLGLPLVVVVCGFAGALEAIGVDAARADLVRDYVYWRAPSLIPYLALVAFRSYLQASGAERAVFWSVLWANLGMLVVAPPLVLGSGALGVPALGVKGAAIAETACTFLQASILALAARRGGARLASACFDASLFATVMRVGLPVGLGLTLEFGVFTLVNVLVALFDAPNLAAHHVAITLASTAFMVPVGIGAAASVRVGHRVGSGDARGARLGGTVAMAGGAVFMALVAAAFALAPTALSRTLTNDASVLTRAAPLLLVAASFQVADGVQAVGAAALRGAGDTRFSLFANLVGHYALGMPLGIFLCVSLGLGARGLWWGLAAGLTAVAVALALRFIRLTARAIPPV
jgi:MATE family multidrug resistance protein